MTRGASERKDSFTDDIRLSFSGIIPKKSNTDGSIKSSTSKSKLIEYFLPIKSNSSRRKKRSNYLGTHWC
jgi:hypothetical protein